MFHRLAVRYKGKEYRNATRGDRSTGWVTYVTNKYMVISIAKSHPESRLSEESKYRDSKTLKATVS